MEIGGLMKGKRGLIMGVANNKSIAWGIAKQCVAAGAEIAMTYQGEVLRGRAESLAKEVGCGIVEICDVTDENSVKGLFEKLAKTWGKLDFVVHAIAFSNKDELQGRYLDTSEENFVLTMNVSCYSFTRVARHAAKIMPDGGSMLTLTYYGAEKVIPNYNVMGVAKAALEASVRYLASDLGRDNIRVNTISAGPIKTLAASGISGLRSILSWIEHNSPMRRNVTQQDIGNAALYLLSDLSNGVTGENLHVDSGYHSIAMKMQEDL